MKTKIITLILCLILSGCSMFEHVGKDGDITRYFRFGEQSIGVGSVELPGGGKLNFEGQESKLPTVTITLPIGGIKIGGEE